MIRTVFGGPLEFMLWRVELYVSGSSTNPEFCYSSNLGICQYTDIIAPESQIRNTSMCAVEHFLAFTFYFRS